MASERRRDPSPARPPDGVDGGGPNLTSSVTAAAVLVTLRALYRLRVHGSVPRRPVPTLVIANHQHDIESLFVPAILYTRGGRRRSVCSVASQRLLEPWFLASRVPAVFAPLAARVPLGRLMARVGMMPLENEPRHRALASLAAEVMANHGDLPVTTVFTPEALRLLGPGGSHGRLSRLTSSALARAATVSVGLQALRQPWRGEVHQRTRERIDRQIEAIEARLRAGATVFLTPEGRVTRDGRLGPMRLVLGRLLPLADEVVLAASSLDSFASRRLSEVVRFALPARGVGIATALAAARPVTLSQLLAVAIGADAAGPVPSAVTAEALTDAVRRQLRSLPKTVFVDPWLRPGRLAHEVRHALGTMTAVGLLARRQDGYVRIGTGRDARLPGIDDAFAFHRTVLCETCAAAERVAHVGA